MTLNASGWKHRFEWNLACLNKIAVYEQLLNTQGIRNQTNAHTAKLTLVSVHIPDTRL